jgi:hypothetical protein
MMSDVQTLRLRNHFLALLPKFCRVLALSDGAMMRIRKRASQLRPTLRGHFLELVAARLSPEPLDREVEQTAQAVLGQIQASSDGAFRL